MNEIQLGVITLIKSAVTGESCVLPDGFSMEKALPILNKHGIQTMGYLGAVNCGIPKTDPIMQDLFRFYCRSAVISQRQLDKIAQLFAAFDENGIDYMPLKGTIMKHLYPAHELRPMADADVLIRMEQYHQIRPVMEALGFAETRESFHELSWRSPELYVELHKCLIPKTSINLFEYYGTGWHLADKQVGFRYQMSAENQFVFLFAHFAKHFQRGGIGCRHVTDLWVFQKKHPLMDQSYISQELNKLQLLEFYHNIMLLLCCWFEDNECDNKIEFISDFIFSSGIWGEMRAWDLAANAMYVDNTGQAGKGKLRFFFSRLFPGYSYTSYQYPILKKAPILLPVIWVVRWVHIARRKPDVMKRRFQMLESSNNDDVLMWKSNMEYVGLRY